MRAYRPAAANPAGSPDNKILGIAIAGSLVLHLALAAIVVPARLQTSPPPEAAPIRIALVPNNPLRMPEPEAAETVSSEPPPAPVTEPPPEVSEADEVVAVPSPEVPEADEVTVAQPRDAAEVPLPESDAPAPVVTVPTVVPDAQNIRQSLQQLQQARGSRLHQVDCDERRRRSDLVDCGEEETPRDYEALETNVTYQALNPVREISRSERTVSTVTGNAAGLAARLRDSDVDPQLSQYLLQELEIGISEHGNQRQSGVETIIRMTDQSAAAQQAREILGDPWVIQRMRELRQRRVTTP